MINKKGNIFTEAVMLALRNRAEDELRSETPGNDFDSTESQRLLHELQVHQIVLRMQVEELQIAYAKSEALITALRESEARLQLSLDYSYDWEFWENPDLTITVMSPSSIDITGIASTEFIAHPELLRSIIHPDDHPIMDQHMQEMTNNPADATLEFRIRKPDGEIRYISHRCRAVFSPERAYLGRRVSNTDITERKQMELRLVDSETRYKTLFDTAKDAILIMSGEVFIDCNAATLEIFRCSRDQIINNPPYKFSPATQPDGRDSKIAAREKIKAALQGQKMLFEWWHQRTDSEVFCAEVSLNTFKIKDESYIVAFVRDISQRKLMEQLLEKQAHIDALTGLNSRGYFLELLEAEIKRAQRYNSPLSVAMLDLDHFKAINDNHGHHVGDIVLKTFAQVAQETLRDIDVIGRVGGEEFVILFPETAIEQALEVAERLRKAVASTPVQIKSEVSTHFTVSIGLATLDNTDIKPNKILIRADHALYQAKDSGRNKVCWLTI